MPNRAQALQRAEMLLQKPECHTLAVDVRSLLALPFLREDDLFALMEPDVCRMAQLPPMDFAALRRQARGRTLADKYDDLSRRVIGANVRPLAEVERAYRMHLACLLPEVNDLLKKARHLGKRLIVYEPGFPVLTNEDVRQMLHDRDAEMPDEIYIDHWGGDVTGASTLTISPEREPQGNFHQILPGPVGEKLHRSAPPEALNYLGYRTMLAVGALHPGVDDADPAAYGDFGMYLFSHAMWLVDECCRGGFDRLNFLARDGFLVKQAFDLVRDALHLPVASGYVRISRQAAFPLHFRKPNDLLALPVLTNLSAHTPKTLLKLFAPVVDMRAAIPAMRERGFSPNEPLNEETAQRFIELFRTKLYDQARFDHYSQQARAYLAPHFQGYCGTWDVGYNLRSESAIADVTGCDLTAFITHTDSDLADRRGVDYRTLMGASPWVSWTVREMFLQEDAPPCIGYGAKGPVLAENAASPCEAVQQFQRQALAFVQDMVDLFGANVDLLHFRPADGCAPFEHFLMAADRKTIDRFRAAKAENEFLDGAKKADDVALEWLLMQSDLKEDGPRFRRIRRVFIRLRYDPKALWDKVKASFTRKKRRG